MLSVNGRFLNSEESWNDAYLDIRSVHHCHGPCDGIHVCPEPQYASVADDDRRAVCFCL